jgi:hypothetical protein
LRFFFSFGTVAAFFFYQAEVLFPQIYRDSENVERRKELGSSDFYVWIAQRTQSDKPENDLMNGEKAEKTTA